MMTSTQPRTAIPTLIHWVGGHPLDSTSGRTADVTNPATGEIVAHLPLASEDEAANGVVAAAKAAFPARRDTSQARRARVLFQFRELLNGFGGWKNSLFGDTHAHGTDGVHFFTRGKVVTTRWLESRSRGRESGLPDERLNLMDRHTVSQHMMLRSKE
jgi:acyl-CoA reductase-like NAD-dependent aldehyde dehydrogenase